MNDTEDRAKLIAKIKKLMALSTSPNENEAARAAEKVQALLAEYNLSMSDVQSTAEDDKIKIFPALKTSSVPWRRALAAQVAQLYFCDYFYTFVKQPTTSRSCGYIRYDLHNFVGAKHNVDVAVLMFTYLTDTVDRLARDGSLSVPIKERTAYMTSFKHTCALRLCRRINERYEAAKAGSPIKSETTGTNLPALTSLYESNQKALELFKEKALPNLKTSKNRGKITNARGAADGRAAGDKISLDTQITGGKRAALLGR